MPIVGSWTRPWARSPSLGFSGLVGDGVSLSPKLAAVHRVAQELICRGVFREPPGRMSDTRWDQAGGPGWETGCRGHPRRGGWVRQLPCVGSLCRRWPEHTLLSLDLRGKPVTLFPVEGSPRWLGAEPGLELRGALYQGPAHTAPQILQPQSRKGAERVPEDVGPREGSGLAKVNGKFLCPPLPLRVFLGLRMHRASLCPIATWPPSMFLFLCLFSFCKDPSPRGAPPYSQTASP